MFTARPSTALSEPATYRSSGGQPLISHRSSGGQPPVSHRSSGGAVPPHMLLSMSSVGGESLADIWRMLDEEGASPRPLTPHIIHEGIHTTLSTPHR